MGSTPVPAIRILLTGPTMRRLVFLLFTAGPVFCADFVSNRPPLASNVYYPLPLTSVKPEGWLRDQLLIQADGLTGHVDEFWPDLGSNSAWLGGSGEGWERGPYYLDGLVPLAYLLDDPRLIAKAKRWVDWTLTHQRPSGALGPAKNDDWWPIMIQLKALTQYQEATGDPRVIPAMQKYFAYQASLLEDRPLFKWAVYRWQDEVLSVLWLYNRTGDRRLLDLAHKLKGQGFDWRRQFENFVFTSKVERDQQTLATHGVNNAMALKTSAVWSVISGERSDREAAARMLGTLDRYHGLPIGILSADEHYAGRNPSQGIELCAVVEAMFSLEHNVAILGDASLGDRLEKLAYNALPATQTADQWGHQYDQQPNQVLCSLSRRDWASNGPESNLFGLEPNYGCCTSNLHQGWPKFLASLWMASADDGLAAAAYGPSRVVTRVRGTEVEIAEETGYPFRETISLSLKTAKPVRFPLSLRIPAWTVDPLVSVNGAAVSGVRAGAFHRIEREWTTGDRVEMVFPMPVRVIPGFNDSVSIERGPLVMALRIGESWRKLKQTGPVVDWEVFPASPWNYALDAGSPFEVSEGPIERQPFQPDKPAVVVKAKGRRLVEWVMVHDSAAAPPASPVISKLPDEILTLVPYGGARLRVTSFPVLSRH